ncbi:MAG: glycerol kinase GlpK [Gammaproteobacteria bacterium]
MSYLLAIDQGTTNSRAIIFDALGNLINQHEILLAQSFPNDGWVEQDPEEMFHHSVECCRQVLKKANLEARQIAGIGISNQRETTIIWDANTGKPIYPAIVWQDRRTAAICKSYTQHPINASIREKTGLFFDPYFSATKIVWLLENVTGARTRAERGELLFGTVDTYLLWKLTKGKSHLTDITNASRTLLFNIHTQQWDAEICQALNIPDILLPKVLDNAADFGYIDQSLLGAAIPIVGMAGDQHAATVGQACFHDGMVKVTYGTGSFMLLNTGTNVIQSRNQLISTIAYRVDGKIAYGLEGSIFSAGVIVKWLRDKLGLIADASETERLAQEVPNNGQVYLVPAFTGLGAPYWDPHARAGFVGLTLDANRAHLVRAALESIGYQTRDLLNAMVSDSKLSLDKLRVDGGMVVNNWLLQSIANILDVEVQRPTCIETSALGAAYLAGLQLGIYQSLDDIQQLWQMKQSFHPDMLASERESLYRKWKKAVKRLGGI